MKMKKKQLTKKIFWKKKIIDFDPAKAKYEDFFDNPNDENKNDSSEDEFNEMRQTISKYEKVQQDMKDKIQDEENKIIKEDEEEDDFDNLSRHQKEQIALKKKLRHMKTKIWIIKIGKCLVKYKEVKDLKTVF